MEALYLELGQGIQEVVSVLLAPELVLLEPELLQLALHLVVDILLLLLEGLEVVE